MNEDLILMERLEARENKDVIIANVCLGLCVVFGVTAGISVPEAIKAFIADPPAVNPANVVTVCGSCSIQ